MLVLRAVLAVAMLVLLGSALGWYDVPGLVGRRHWIPWILLGLFVLSMLIRFSRRAPAADDGAARSRLPR